MKTLRFGRILNLTMSGLFLLLAGSPFVQAASSCDRECLKGHVDQFLDAILKHDPASLPMAPDATVLYNGKPSKLGADDIWKVVDKIPFHQYAMDPASGEVAFFGVADEAHKRGTLFVRLAIKNHRITLAEMIAGERTLDGVPGLISPNPFFDYV
ncbi:MAG: hypothetical protein JSR95_06625, partial [Proteobacteria bacterium]|nr:hypothetical protein [Pseudomonadota bacterium]